MSRTRERGGQWPPRYDRRPTKSTDRRLPASNVARGVAPITELAEWRSFRSWVAAVEHLNAIGYPAAVPAGLVGPLSRRGLAVWPARVKRVA